MNSIFSANSTLLCGIDLSRRRGVLSWIRVTALILVAAFGSIPQKLSAQDLPLDRDLPVAIDTLQVTGVGPFLIRPFLVASTVKIWANSSLLQHSEYELDPVAGFIRFKTVASDSSFFFVASYAFVPLELSSTYSFWPASAQTDKNSPAKKPVSLGKSTALVSKGTVSRGILTGSGRDAAVESGLRLEVSGMLTDSVSVKAVLTDEDSPLLPEGTTSRIDQFDQVFIEFGAPAGSVKLGDMDVAYQASSFARLQRRVQGVSLNADAIRLSTQLTGTFRGVGSTSRGSFRSQTLSIKDGVQGPYRLEGGAGERFVLILPGTEKVYVDGVLQNRGLDADYVVDYSLGEISFTSAKLVGSENRVRVDFEYTFNQFTRSLLATEGEIRFNIAPNASRWLDRSATLTSADKSFLLGVSAMRERDGDAFTQELGFSEADSVLIRNAGDGTVFKSGAEEVVYDPEALFTQYFQVIDEAGVRYEVVNRLPTPGEKVFRVQFAFVGPQNGEYIRTGATEWNNVVAHSNGIMYQFVGLGRGSYSAEVPLAAPKQKEIVSMRFATPKTIFGRVSGEWATSRNDRNTLSRIDSADDIGFAHAVNLSSPEVDVLGFKSMAQVSVIQRSKTFSTFDRARNIEFERDWNLPSITSDVTSNLLANERESAVESSLRFEHPDSSVLELGYDRLELGSVIDASRKQLALYKPENRLPTFSVSGSIVSLSNTLTGTDTDWAAFKSRVSVNQWAGLQHPFIEWEAEREKGEVYASLNSKEYDAFRIGSEYGTSSHRVSVTLEQRLEYPTSFIATESDLQTIRSNWRYSAGSRLSSNIQLGARRIHRSLGGDAPGQPTSNTQTSLLMGLNGYWTFGLSNRFNWFYEVQSEQSARMQEIYIRTGQERGTYVWQDINADGLIQLDEFIPETTPGEGEYALTYFPTDSLESITALTASLRFNRSGDKESNRLGRIGLASVVEVVERTRDPSKLHVYLLQLGTFRSPNQSLNGRIRVAQQLFLMPGNDRFDLDVSFSEVRSFADLAAGPQSSQIATYGTEGRYRPSAKWSVEMGWESSRHQSRGSFASRTFSIDAHQLSPTVLFRPKPNWQIRTSVEIAQKREKTLNTKVQAVKIPVQIQLRTANKWSSRIHLERSSFNVDGPSRGLQTYELTDGRGPGQSWLWGLAFDARLTEVVTATFGYDGRRPSVGKTIHTGRVQLMARF